MNQGHILINREGRTGTQRCSKSGTKAYLYCSMFPLTESGLGLSYQWRSVCQGWMIQTWCCRDHGMFWCGAPSRDARRLGFLFALFCFDFSLDWEGDWTEHSWVSWKPLLFWLNCPTPESHYCHAYFPARLRQMHWNWSWAFPFAMVSSHCPVSLLKNKTLFSPFQWLWLFCEGESDLGIITGIFHPRFPSNVLMLRSS